MIIEFDNPIAHRIQSGSDAFLMPSRFEPCGLTQMYALRYGSAPVVRATGGLRDTVSEFDPARGTGNGFVFDKFEATDMVAALGRMVSMFKDRPKWQAADDELLRRQTFRGTAPPANTSSGSRGCEKLAASARIPPVAPSSREYLVYADGSCIGNPGPGGWGVVVRDPDSKVTELNGHDDATTNNRMELMGAIEGLRATDRGAHVILRSDSQYVVNTMTLRWKRNKNQDLWVLLDAEVALRHVRFEWVRGHDIDPINNRADELALMGAQDRLARRRCVA